MPAKESEARLGNVGSNGKGNSVSNGGVSDGGVSNGANGNGNGHDSPGLKRLAVAPADPVAEVVPVEDFPASTRIFLEDGELRVPVRRIEVGGGEAPVGVYDTFGPR